MAGIPVVRAYRTELDPTVEQRRALSRAAGAARWAYNWGLAEWRRQYEAGEKPSWMSLHKQLTQVKREPETAWLRDVSAYVVREALADLGDAYKHFFRRIKEGQRGRSAGEPQFRSRQDPSGRGFRIAQPVAIGVEANRVKIAGVGWIRLKERGYIPVGANYRGLSCRDVAGRWYVSVLVEAEVEQQPLAPSKRVGVEVGVRKLAVTSEGQEFGAIRDLKNLDRAERRRHLWERRMARRHKKGVARREQSAGWHEAVRNVQRLHAECAAIRRDALHQATTRIVRSSRAETLVLRDMQVSKMIGRAGKEGAEARARNAIAPMVSKVGMFELRRQIEYKQKWAGGTVEIAPSDYPSTRTCSACGVVRETDPGYPHFRCGTCGRTLDREANSALNLRDFRGSSPETGGGARRRKTARAAQRPDEPGSSAAGSSLAPSTSPDGDETSALGTGNRAPREQSLGGTERRL